MTASFERRFFRYISVRCVIGQLVIGSVPDVAFSVTPDAASPQVTESILYSFKGYLAGGEDGIGPNGVVLAKDGNLYGTTDNGGAYNGVSCGDNNGDGTLFRVTTAGAETLLYCFSCAASGAKAGGIPASLLTVGKDGDLYGTSDGGAAYGFVGLPGTVFKFTLAGAETILHDFLEPSGVSKDGEVPNSLIQATDGNFYGTTQSGGSDGVGTVFRVTSAGAETVLHTFSGGINGSTDGAKPYSSLIEAKDGYLYGTTSSGGAHGVGTVFKITANGTLSILHSFSGGVGGSKDGASPFAGLVQGSNGNLYGSTFFGGASSTGVGTGVGTIFEITTSGVETLLYSFKTSHDGQFPGRLIVGSDGNFYGVTQFGGSAATARATGSGTIFKATSSGKVTLVYSFLGKPSSNSDGLFPVDLIEAPNGTFFGATTSGGTYDEGTIFKLNGIIAAAAATDKQDDD